MTLFRFLTLFFSIVLSALISQSAIAEQSLFGAREALSIETKSGTYTFQVEIADTPQKRSRGLMFREQMQPTHGMLFDFKTDAPVSMWMENTILPLDMIFIKPDGIVHRIERGTTPFSREIISSGGPVSHVLELNAGISLQIGLEPGDELKHRFFDLEN